MSGPEDTRETAERAGTSPAAAAPPSFGGAETPEGAPPAGLPTLPPFGLETPWWASDDTSSDAAPGDTAKAAAAPPPAESAPPAEPVPEPDAEPPSEPPTEQTSEQPVPTSEQSTGTEQAAFERARQAEKASAPLAPVLVPDAIHPPGFVPPTGSGPHPQVTPPQPDAAVPAGAPQAAPDTGGTVIAPAYHAEGGLPIDVPPQAGGTGQPPTPPVPPPAPGTPKPLGSRRRPLLIGAGAAVVLTAVGALFALNGSGEAKDDAARQAAGRPAGQATSAAPTSPPASTSAQPAPPTGKPSKIDDEKTDKKDLAFTDVFPSEAFRLAGHAYVRDRWSINRTYRYAANGAMLEALKRQKCRKVVRATYIDKERSIAVTSGIAVLPTKAAALAVSQAGDPAKYEWFRGMAGKNSAAIDRAGGYAASTVRGRYVIYSYVQYADGKHAQPGDPVIKQVAQQFLDYTTKPINAR